LGVGASGVATSTVLLTGLAGLLAGALSMGAGEYVSIRSQRELLEASSPNPALRFALQHLDINANELALVYRARGMAAAEAEAHADRVLRRAQRGQPTDTSVLGSGEESLEVVGTGAAAALSSFCFFASGAAIPVLPYAFGLAGTTAVVVAAVLVGLALLGTGAVLGVLSSGPPLRRALGQVPIRYAAAGLTHLLRLLFGAASG